VDVHGKLSNAIHDVHSAGHFAKHSIARRVVRFTALEVEVGVVGQVEEALRRRAVRLLGIANHGDGPAAV